ncbi:hypothetical protein ACXET9_11035 [Brachybacterium sp. DNPG3]
MHAERYREAVELADRFRGPAERIAARSAAAVAGDGADAWTGAGREVWEGASRSDDADLIAYVDLLRARMRAIAAMGEETLAAEALYDLLGALRRCGHVLQAEATATALLEHSAPADSAHRRRASSPGRRRAATSEMPPALMAVVRALDSPAPGTDGAESLHDAVPSAGGFAVRGRPLAGGVDPADAARVLSSALAALPEVRHLILGDVEPLLRMRLAQALEASGRRRAAITAALDVLELLENAEATTGREVDPDRAGIAARAVLARTLGVEHPLEAVHHALDALLQMSRIDDPPLRIGLITDLLKALVGAGLESLASFTAGRLASLQRTLDRDELRVAPLLAVATQRIGAERYDAAEVALDQVRRIADDLRDRYSTLEVARLTASIHDRRGESREAMMQLEKVANDAQWLCEDLGTPSSARGGLLRIELDARALVMRRALDLGETARARGAAAAIERRTGLEVARAMTVPEHVLWDHRADARIGALVAVGQALSQREPGVSVSDYERLHARAQRIVSMAPPGHEERAEYWSAYLNDRHAAMLAERGQHDRALRVARIAREAWNGCGDDDDRARMDALITELETRRA